MMIERASFFIVSVLLFLSACSNDSVDPQLTGTWQATMTNEQGSMTMEFTPASNGTYRTVFKGPVAIADHVGTFQAKNGQYRVKKSTGESDQGTYQFISYDDVMIKGSGPALTWHRINGGTSPVAKDQKVDAIVVDGVSNMSSRASASTLERAKAQAIDPDAEQLYQRGKALRDAGRDREAVSLYRQAAERGHPMAQHVMGYWYQNGEMGFPKDERQAATWFTKSAAQGNRAAQYALGSMYEEGEGGLPKDEVKAAQLYRQSAEQQYGKAEFSLGLAYEFGFGVPRDRKQAIYWLNKSGSQGDGRAQWIADWLKNPATPHFKDEVQLRQYIDAKMTAWMHQYGGSSSSGGTSSSGSSSSGSSSSGGGCSYSSYAACNAAKNGDYWAADRIQNGTSSGSEKSWYNR